MPRRKLAHPHFVVHLDHFSYRLSAASEAQQLAEWCALQAAPSRTVQADWERRWRLLPSAVLPPELMLGFPLYMELQPDGTYTQAAEEAWDKALLARLEHGGEPHLFGHEYTVPSVAYALQLLDYQAAALPSTARRQKLMRYVHQLVTQRVRALTSGAAAWATDDPVERTGALQALQAASHWQPLLDERVPLGGTANAKIVLLDFLRKKSLFDKLDSESWHTVLAAVLEVQPDTVARYLNTRDPASSHFIYGPKELEWASQVLEEVGLSTVQVSELHQVAARQVRRRPGK